MNEYQLVVMTPEGEVFNGSVIELSLRGAGGDLAVFAGHIPFITTVKPGRCTVTLPSEEEVVWELSSGVLDVGKDQVKLLAGGIKHAK